MIEVDTHWEYYHIVIMYEYVKNIILLCKIFTNTRKPINEQPIECIKYVYDLLPKDTNE